MPNNSKFNAILFAACFCLAGFAQTPRSQSLGFFNWDPEKCPPYREIANGSWRTDRLEDLSKRIANANATRKEIKFDDYWKLDFVVYTYNFKGSQDQIDGTSTHKFRFLLGGTDRDLILWRDSSQEDEAGLTDIRAYKLGKRMILEFEYFTGGTAGFYEEYYDFLGGNIQPITESFIEEARPLIPKEFSIRRVQVDLNKMTGCIFLARKSDANCCPSGQLIMQLSLLGREIHLVKDKFELKQ